MAEFLVRIDIDTGDLETSDVDRLRAAEAARAAELASSGTLIALWRVPGRWANIGVWSAANRSTLDQVLSSLPLHPYMSITVEQLDEHPSDPRATVARSPETFPSLPPLPELRMRRRGDLRGPFARPAPTAVPLPDLPELIPRGRARVRQPTATSTQRVAPTVTGVLEVDVTGVVGLSQGSADLIVRSAIAAVLDDICSADTASGVSRPDLTHSGADGIDTAFASTDGRLSVDVGRVRRIPTVRPLPGGAEAIQVRSIVTLSATADSSYTVQSVAALLIHIRDRLSRQTD